MDKHRFGFYVRVFLAAGCFVMGLLSLAGVFSTDVANRRLIFGAGWILIGAGWLVRCYIGWKHLPPDRKTENDS
jgi:hypothetical protein